MSCTARWRARPCRCASGRWWSSPTAPTAPTASPETSAMRSIGGLRDLRHRRGPGDRRGELSRIGRSGTFVSRTRNDIERGFDEIGARIEASSSAYYLLSYCSPSRAGRPPGRDRGGRARRSGRLSHPSTPHGFGPTCDPEPEAGVRRAPTRGSIPPDAVAPRVAERRPRAAPPPSSSGNAPAGSRSAERDRRAISDGRRARRASRRGSRAWLARSAPSADQTSRIESVTTLSISSR